MPSGVYERTKYHNEINSKGHKGQIPWIKGKKMSDEFKDKIRKANLEGRCGNRGRKFTKEHKEKIGKSNSIALKGRRVDESVKLKIRKTLIKRFGIDPKNRIYGIDWTKTLRKIIRKRDNYICQMTKCNKNQKDRAHDVHHIDYDKKNNNPDNLITLCGGCHPKTNSNRDYWKKFFGLLLESS